MKLISKSAEETIGLGERIGRLIKGGDIVAFRGDLGAGKTTLTRGIAIGMGLGDNVTSPTFALVNEYRREGKTPLIHFDMYRIKGTDELDVTGFYDYLDEGCAVAVEWSENIEDALSGLTIRITLRRIDDNTREIEISGDDRFDCLGN